MPAVGNRGEAAPAETRSASQTRTQPPPSESLSSPGAGVSKPASLRRSLPPLPARQRHIGPQTVAGLECVTQGYWQLYHTTAGADLFVEVAQHANLPWSAWTQAAFLRSPAPDDDEVADLWVPKTRPRHATCAYSWISPPSRSTRTTRMAAAETAGATAARGEACPSERCGRWSL